jgi:hypothetical protein
VALDSFANFKSGKNSKPFTMIYNYIYMYHLNEFIILPTYPEQVNDTSTVNFTPNTPLARSAPIYSYSNSGPRQVGFTFKFHREMMKQINYKKSNASVTIDDDYVDLIVRYLQAAAYPKYGDTEKLVDPPLVAVRLGDDIYIKGIVSGSVQITYDLPIITDENGNDKYAIVTIGFTINEVDPYDAETVALAGSFRGLNSTLERNLWKTGNSLSSSLVSNGNSIKNIR